MKECMGSRTGNCEVFECRYNVFEGIDPEDRHPNKETDLMRNCVFNVDRKWTLEEIAEIWGLSRERIRQVEEKAINRLAIKVPDHFYELFNIKPERMAERKHRAHEFFAKKAISNNKRFEAMNKTSFEVDQ